MRKEIKKYLVIIIASLLIIFLFRKCNWLPSFTELFSSKPLLIDNTPILIKQINNLSQLITISMYDEVVMEAVKKKTIPSLPGLQLVPDKIVLIGKGKVLAGVDLSKIKQNNLSVSKDSVTVYMPAAQIFSTIINPSDFEIFDEQGSWSPQEVTSIKMKLRDKVTARALQNNILPKAYNRSKLILENFLRSAGFKKIVFVQLSK